MEEQEAPKKKVYKKKWNEARQHYLPEWKKQGAKIKAKRLALGLTAQDMAEALGLSLGYYNHIEQGFNSFYALPVVKRHALCKTLKIKIDDLNE